MASSHDRKQDQRLDALAADAAALRKRINANVRKIKQIADQMNARLDALASESGPTAPAPADRASPRAPRGQGGKPRGPRPPITPKGVKPK